jgi:dTMP kinase
MSFASTLPFNSVNSVYMQRARFITFEGGEAVGKSTQIERLAARLQERGDEVLVTREPGGTPLGEQIRHLLKHAPEGQGMSPKTELLLFLASRAELVRKVIGPALDRGAWVLCDRFHDSTTVYQGAGRGIPLEVVERLNGFALGVRMPGLTLVLDLEPEQARARMLERAGTIAAVADRMEEQPAEFFERVRKGYATLAADHPERVKIIPAHGGVGETAEAIWAQVAETFSV